MGVIPHRRDAETRRNITKTQGDRRGGRGNRRFPGCLRSAACILCVCLRETPVTSAPSAISGFDFVFSSAPLRLCGDSGVLRIGCGSAAVSLCGENLRDAPLKQTSEFLPPPLGPCGCNRECRCRDRRCRPGTGREWRPRALPSPPGAAVAHGVLRHGPRPAGDAA